jgi:pimeloyl-ACP methyl ester carboxylesterase
MKSTGIGRRALLAGLVTTLTSMALPDTASAEAALIEEEWTEGHLSGTFTRPAQMMKRGPAALIIAGSGPTLRDGNADTYKLIAAGLAANRIRSLRYDKRGVGKSRLLVTREDDLVIQALADDVVLAAASLARRDDVSSVILVGHSEGALLAILAAAKVQVAGIILLAGIGRPLDVVLREQLAALPLPPAQEHFRTDSYAIIDKLVRGERVSDISPQQAPLFRPSVQPFLISTFAIDPAAELAKLRAAALIVWGESDIQVKRSDFDALAKARPDAKAIALPLTNHVFKPAPADTADRAAQLKSYDKAAPLAPGLVPALVTFIRSITR